MANDLPKICCVVSWEGVPFDVEISGTRHTYYLGKLAHANREYPLRFIGTTNLMLYKLEIDVPVNPPETLLERLPRPSQFSTDTIMDTASSTKTYFGAQPPTGCIHVVVHAHPTERQYRWINLLFERYWGRNDLRNDIFSQASMVVPCYESDESQTRAGIGNISYIVLNLGPDFNGFMSDDSQVLITQEYQDTLWYLEGRERHAGVIVTGRPGIGKATFLHYVLLERVLAAKPTAIQSQGGPGGRYIMITGDQGVYYAGLYGPVASEANPEAWALVDSDALGNPPDATLYKFLAPYFIVQVTAPKLERWTNWRDRYPPLIAMHAWTWDEIYITHCIRKHPFDTDRLRSVFVKFGGSIAVCLALSALEDPDAIDLYEKKLQYALDTRLIHAIKATALKEPSSEPDICSSIVSIEPGFDRCPETCIVSRYMEILISESLLRKEEPLWHAIARIWKQLSLVTLTGTTRAVSPFRAEPLFCEGPSIDISLPMMTIKYSHDRLLETLVENSSLLSCPNLCFQLVGGPTRATYDLLQVDVGQLYDLWDGLADAALEDARVNAWFNALSPDGFRRIPFQLIFVLSKKREEGSWNWNTHMVSVDCGEERRRWKGWDICVEFYRLVPPIGEGLE